MDNENGYEISLDIEELYECFWNKLYDALWERAKLVMPNDPVLHREFVSAATKLVTEGIGNTKRLHDWRLIMMIELTRGGAEIDLELRRGR